MPNLSSLSRVLAGTFAVGVASLAGLLYVHQRALIYPSSIPEDSRTNVDTPDKFNLPFDEYRLTTPDHVKVHVYAILQQGGPNGDDKNVARTRPTILMFHANAGNMVRCAA